MRICQLLHAMTTGGAEVLADRIGRRFRDRHDVVFACLDGLGELGQALRDDGYTVEVLDRGAGIDTGCMRRLARTFRGLRVDLIHAHQYTPFFYAAASRLCGHRLPIVFTEHGRFFPDYPSRKRAVFNRWMLRRRDRVVAVGRQVRQALVANESIPADRIEVIYNGIDLTAYAGGDCAEQRRAVRGDLRLGGDDFVIAQVARLDSIKDHVTSVRALALLAARRPGVHLLIIGDGPQRSEIAAEIERQGVGGRVHLLGLRRDVPALLAACDAAMLTSLSEGIPLSLIEGMAQGLPVVSTDVGGVREVVTEGGNGLLCPVGDATAIASALGRLADDGAFRQRLGQDGRQAARERFGEEQMFAQYERLFDQVAAA